MLEYKFILTVIGIGIGFISYIPYLRDVITRRTKPHVFSWFIWGLVTGIAFFAQILSGGGVGAWVTGFTAFLCLTITAFALFQGEKDITRLDRVSFVAALLGVVIWVFTENPLWAVIIVTVVDLLGFIPTFRKVIGKPYEETVSTFAISSVKFALSIIALETYTVVTWLYPASLVITNALFVILVLMRRHQLKTV